MKLTNHGPVPVYTISGSSTARPLPEWLARKRRRSLKQDPEYASRIELLQDFEFEEASSCIRASDDGDWVVSTGKPQAPEVVQAIPTNIHFHQEPISLRSMSITYRISPCRTLATQMARTRPSSSCHQTTRSSFTFRQTASWSFTHQEDATIPLEYHATAGTWYTTSARLKL